MRRIYIAGPYSSDPEQNTRNAIDAADRIFSLGYYPYVPHFTHFWHLQNPRPYEDWMRLDLEWLPLCDALVRLPGDSFGADLECAKASLSKIPIYVGLDAFLARHEMARKVDP